MSTRQPASQGYLQTHTRPVLSLDLTIRGHVAVINVQGQLRRTTTHLLTELVEHVTRSHCSHVLLNLAQVHVHGRYGLGALRQAYDAITAAGGRLVLRASADAPDARTKGPATEPDRQSRHGDGFGGQPRGHA